MNIRIAKGSEQALYGSREVEIVIGKTMRLEGFVSLRRFEEIGDEDNISANPTQNKYKSNPCTLQTWAAHL